MSDKYSKTLIAMTSDKATSNKKHTDITQQSAGPEATKNASLQFGLSVSLGVLVIVLFMSTIYLGIFR